MEKVNTTNTINDASTFHGPPEAAQDLINLVNDSISQSKALTTIKAN